MDRYLQGRSTLQHVSCLPVYCIRKNSYREATVCWVGSTSRSAVLFFQILGEVRDETRVRVEGVAAEPICSAETPPKPYKPQAEAEYIPTGTSTLLPSQRPLAIR